MHALLRTILLAIVCISIAASAFAQSGAVCLYADAGATVCSLADAVPGLIQVYIIHHPLPGGATAVEFSAPMPACMANAGVVYLGDTWPFPVVIGDTQTGVAVAYGSCQTAPVQVGLINYFGTGLTPADCAYPVLPDPGSTAPTVREADCSPEPATFPIAGGVTYVNSSIPCECGTTGTDPLLAVTPLFLNLGTYQNQGNFTIANIGGGELTWSVSESAPWLGVAPTSGSGNQSVTVFVDRSGLLPGNHSATVQVSSNGGSETVTVQLEVQGPELGVSPSLFDFGSQLTSGTLTITNEGAGDLSWTVTPNQPWLAAAPPSGLNDGTVLVTVDRSGLPDGSYVGTLGVASNGGSTSVHVMMDVVTVPILQVSPLTLNFSPGTTALNLTISNVGVPTLEWQVNVFDPWITVDPPASGTENGFATVRVDPTLVPPGPQNTGITVTSNGGDVSVSVNYTPAPSGFGGLVGVYADQSGANCLIADIQGLVTMYVVHTFTPGATAVQFSAPFTSCMAGLTYLSDAPAYPVTIGNSQTGVAVGYGACLVSPIHILTINAFGTGVSPCCPYRVLPDPSEPSGEIIAVDCNNTLTIASGATTFVSDPGIACSCGLINVEQTTWGKVKAMYAD